VPATEGLKMNAATVSRLLNSKLPSLKNEYRVSTKNGEILVTVTDFQVQLILENAINNFGAMCVQTKDGFVVA
jgi:hypothetical protein